MPLSPLTAFRKRAVFSSGIGMGPGVTLRCGRFGRGFFGRLAALSVAGFMVRFLMAENSIVSIDPLWAIRLKIRNYSGTYDRGCFLYVFCGHAHRLQLVRHACERLSKSAEIWRRNHLAHDTGTDAAHRPRAATWCGDRSTMLLPAFDARNEKHLAARPQRLRVDQFVDHALDRHRGLFLEVFAQPRIQRILRGAMLTLCDNAEIQPETNLMSFPCKPGPGNATRWMPACAGMTGRMIRGGADAMPVSQE